MNTSDRVSSNILHDLLKTTRHVMDNKLHRKAKFDHRPWKDKTVNNSTRDGQQTSPEGGIRPTIVEGWKCYGKQTQPQGRRLPERSGIEEYRRK